MNRQRGPGPDSAAIHALRSADPVMARLIDRLEPIDLATWRARWLLDSFGSLARSIVGQQIATPAATAIFARLRRCGTWRCAHSTVASILTGWAS